MKCRGISHTELKRFFLQSDTLAYRTTKGRMWYEIFHNRYALSSCDARMLELDIIFLRKLLCFKLIIRLLVENFKKNPNEELRFQSILKDIYEIFCIDQYTEAEKN